MITFFHFWKWNGEFWGNFLWEEKWAVLDADMMRNHHESQQIGRRPKAMIAQTAGKLREQIARFSGKLSWGLCKPARRLVHEMIYGIQARQSVRLSEVVRSLEENIPFIKTEMRLSNNMARPELRPILQRALLREGAPRVGRDSLLVLDPSDVIKPYALKMECLARVRDGSTKEIGNGYETMQVIAVEPEGEEITPLYGDLFSSEADDFVSENDEILRAIRLVSAATQRRGIWVIDRGGDRGELYDELVPVEKSLRFLVRQRGDRHLFCGRDRRATTEIARSCPLPYATMVVREVKGKEVVHHLEYGFREVRLPEHPAVPLWLVVVTGFGEEPMMLLTNVPQRKNRNVLWRTVSSYITRWRIEETIRFGKQSYGLEDVRVLTYERLRNMMALVTAVMFFAAVVLGTRTKLEILVSHVYRAAKRFFGIPNFRYYAIADGIGAILTRHPRRLSMPTDEPTDQLALFTT